MSYMWISNRVKLWSAASVLTGMVLAAPASAVMVQDWQFNDPVDTQLNLVANDGSIGTAWNFRMGNPDEGLTDGSNFVVGDDGAGGASSLPISKDYTRKATFTDDAVSSGIYTFETRISGWDLDAAPVAGTGTTLKLSNSGGANQINLVFNIINAGDNVRARHATSGGVGGSAGQNILNGLVSTEGIVVQVNGDFDSGAWTSSWKYDSDVGFTDIVTDGTGFTSIDEIIWTVEGSTPWGAGDHVDVDYISLDVIPEPATLGFVGLGLLLLGLRRRG